MQEWKCAFSTLWAPGVNAANSPIISVQLFNSPEQPSCFCADILWRKYILVTVRPEIEML